MQLTKRDEFERLYAEYVREYVSTPTGQAHLASYGPMREQGVRNLLDIVASRARGEDVTDAVLRRLLPYADNAGSRSEPAWVHTAAAIHGDLKKWFERAKWTKPEDWPSVAEAILAFVLRCRDYPAELATACEEFSAFPYSKGFQSGMLSPILNAVNPDDFRIVNSKSCKVTNFLAGTKLGQTLVHYSQTNEVIGGVVGELAESMRPQSLPEGARRDDAFDVFCHWLVAVKKYAFESGIIEPSPELTLQELEPESLQAIADTPEGNRLARPFSLVFRDWDEALQGYDLLAKALGFLGITDPDDERFALTLNRLSDAKSRLRLDFCAWAIMDFEYSAVTPSNMRLSLLVDSAASLGAQSRGEAFATEPSEPQVGWYELPINRVADPMTGALDAFGATCRQIARRFANHGRTNVRKFNQPRLAAPLFAPDRLAEVLRERVPNGIVVEPGYFTSETFELLAGLADEPTRAYYQSHRDELKEQLETPLDALLTALARELPQEALELLETDKGLTSRIPKNDWGRGAAWPYKWGAFYPKGGQRTADAQLFAAADQHGLSYGFYIGEKKTEARDRFHRNLADNREALLGMLAESFDTTGIVCGNSDAPAASADDWLRSSEPYPGAGLTMTANEVVSLSKEELVRDIARVFRLMFPLVLLATSETPMPAILSYLGKAHDGLPQPAYTMEEFAADTSFPMETLMEWKVGLERKKQAIFYGPPGTGKTYVAQKLARHLVAGTDGLVEIVQFHPAYAYEDFVQGIRPLEDEGGGLRYPVVPGHFVEFCRKAAQRQGPCVLIIDEINRAELARVFGELMYLLEYRDQPVRLAADRRPFSIPSNVRIIGTMNTADRSIALVDHALRRRFAFVALRPNYDVLRKFHAGSDFGVEGLIRVLDQLNREIVDPNYALGITFFLHRPLEKHLRSIWQMEIVPYLEEYFFDKPARVNPFRWESIQGQMLPGQQ